MQQFIMLMDRNIKQQLIIYIKIVIINYVFKLGHLEEKENIHHQKKNFDLVRLIFLQILYISSLFSLDNDGRLLIRKFYFMIFYQIF